LTLAEVQGNVLDDQTALLEYNLGTESSYLWVVTNASKDIVQRAVGQQLTGASLPINGAALEHGFVKALMADKQRCTRRMVCLMPRPRCESAITSMPTIRAEVSSGSIAHEALNCRARLAAACKEQRSFTWLPPEIRTLSSKLYSSSAV